jgi:hypothetical protein
LRQQHGYHQMILSLNVYGLYWEDGKDMVFRGDGIARRSSILP